MPGLSTARKNALLLVFLLSFQLLLMSGSARSVEGATLFESWWIRLSSPFVKVGRALAGGFQGTGAGIRSLLVAQARNMLLQAENERLRDELMRYREAERENGRLRRLLGRS